MPLDLPPVFTTHQAYDAGWTMSGLRHAVRRGRVLRVRHGVYTTVGEADLRTRIVASALRYPDAVASHRAAVALRAGPLLGVPPLVPDLTVPPRTNANLLGVHVYRATLRPQDVCEIDGVRVTSVARTVVDVARHCPFAVAVAVADAALHDGLTSEAVLDVLDHCHDWYGIRSARRVIAFADGRAESPLESLSRVVIARLGLPAPELQTDVVDRRRVLIGRSDFYWDEVGVVGEADGRSKYGSDLESVNRVLDAEKERHEQLEDLGVEVARWGWQHAQRDRAELRRRIERASDRGRRRDALGSPRLWTPRFRDAVTVLPR